MGRQITERLERIIAAGKLERDRRKGGKAARAAGGGNCVPERLMPTERALMIRAAEKERAKP